MQFRNKKLIVRSSGFTLMEMMAVIGVSMVGLLGVSSLVVQNLQAQNVNRHYPVAAMLAQEAVELVRNQRDNNWLAGGDWKNADQDIIQDDDYTINYNLNISSTPDAITDNGTKLYSNNATGFYTHVSTGGTETVYRRLVEIDDDPGGDMIKITVTVRWTDRGRDFDYVLKNYLYDWR